MLNNIFNDGLEKEKRLVYMGAEQPEAPADVEVTVEQETDVEVIIDAQGVDAEVDSLQDGAEQAAAGARLDLSAIDTKTLYPGIIAKRKEAQKQLQTPEDLENYKQAVDAERLFLDAHAGTILDAQERIEALVVESEKVIADAVSALPMPEATGSEPAAPAESGGETEEDTIESPSSPPDDLPPPELPSDLPPPIEHPLDLPPPGEPQQSKSGFDYVMERMGPILEKFGEILGRIGDMFQKFMDGFNGKKQTDHPADLPPAEPDTKEKEDASDPNKAINEEIAGGNFERSNKATALTVEAAQKIATSDAPIKLDGLTTMDADVAGKLRERTQSLSLNGLTDIEGVAGLLATEKGGSIELNGVKKLSVASATEVAKHKGNLSFNGITDLPADVATAFAPHKGELQLKGIPELSSEVYQALIAHKDGKVVLNDTAQSKLMMNIMAGMLLPGGNGFPLSTNMNVDGATGNGMNTPKST